MNNDLDLIKKGFNAGYLLAKFDPKLSSQLLKDLKDKDLPYAKGYMEGVKEYTRERLKEQLKMQPRKKDRGKDHGIDR